MQPPFHGQGGQRIAYIRQIPVEKLPPEMREGFQPQSGVYGIHSPEGQVLALTADRQMAFLIARTSDLSPVSAH